MSAKIITGDDYRSSLHDGRQVYYDGSLVADLSAHPRFAAAVDVTAASYDHAMEQRDASDQPDQELEHRLRRRTSAGKSTSSPGWRARGI